MAVAYRRVTGEDLYRSDVSDLRSSPAYQRYQLLHWVLTAAPIIAGADKFTNLLTRWPEYLAPIVRRMTGLNAQGFMWIVGVIEIVAGLIVAVKPRYGAYLAAVWLWAIIINLLLIPGYYDIALRDFGLSIAALALARLSLQFDPSR